MPRHAPRQQAAPSRDQAPRQAAPRPADGLHAGYVPAADSLATMADTLNGSPAVQLLDTLSRDLSASTLPTDAPVQGVLIFNNGTVYNNGENVEKSQALNQRLNGLPEGKDILAELAGMAGEAAEHRAASWNDFIQMAQERLGGGDGGGLDEEEAAAEAFHFDGFDPDAVDDEDMPSDEQYFALARRGSIDFSEQFEAKFGIGTGDARTRILDIEHLDTGNEYHVGGPGRFMTMSNSQLGHTVYAQFIPGLAAKTGLDEAELSRVLHAGLYDRDDYAERTAELTPDAKRALEQTLTLLHNEIINRSSANLPTITGALEATMQDADTSLNDRLSRSAMFYPTAGSYRSKTGGQQMSRLHHEGSTGAKKLAAEKLEPGLLGIKDNAKKGLAGVSRKYNIDIGQLHDLRIKGMQERYISNLARTYKITPRELPPKAKDKGEKRKGEVADNSKHIKKKPKPSGSGKGKKRKDRGGADK
ncbi:MAG TPA: hypothetical protein VEB20_23450 [Azospirillaceae bacterium]|nr:hypothetical protein [Azospirillaceae bacterium]